MKINVMINAITTTITDPHINSVVIQELEVNDDIWKDSFFNLIDSVSNLVAKLSNVWSDFSTCEKFRLLFFKIEAFLTSSLVNSASESLIEFVNFSEIVFLDGVSDGVLADGVSEDGVSDRWKSSLDCRIASLWLITMYSKKF